MATQTAVLAQDGRAAAEALFKEGRNAMRAKDYAAACPKFMESQRLDPAPGTLLNLAACEEKLGKLASAWQRLEEALQTLEARDPRRKSVEKQAQKLDPRVPRLVLVPAPEMPSEVTVSVDDIALGAATLGVPLPTDPGEHLVVVEVPGHEERRYAVTLAEGERKELTIEPGSALPPPPPPKVAAPPKAAAPPPAEEPRGPSIAPWIVGGVGVAGLLVAAVGAGMVLDSQATVDDECGADRTCSSAGIDATSRGRTWSTVATVAFVVGIAGVGTSTVLFLTAGGNDASATALPTHVRATMAGRF